MLWVLTPFFSTVWRLLKIFRLFVHKLSDSLLFSFLFFFFNPRCLSEDRRYFRELLLLLLFSVQRWYAESEVNDVCCLKHSNYKWKEKKLKRSVSCFEQWRLSWAIRKMIVMFSFVLTCFRHDQIRDWIADQRFKKKKKKTQPFITVSQNPWYNLQSRTMC